MECCYPGKCMSAKGGSDNVPRIQREHFEESPQAWIQIVSQIKERGKAQGESYCRPHLCKWVCSPELDETLDFQLEGLATPAFESIEKEIFLLPPELGIFCFR